jgi:hypothetical protein
MEASRGVAPGEVAAHQGKVGDKEAELAFVAEAH